jgi:hypothetical protein
VTAECAKVLRFLAWAIIAAGLVGLIGAVLGWDKDKAAPALFAAATAFAAFWGLVMLATISMIGKGGIVLATETAVCQFHTIAIVLLVGIGVWGVIEIRDASHWLYLSLAATVAALVVMIVYIRTAQAALGGGGGEPVRS